MTISRTGSEIASLAGVRRGPPRNDESRLSRLSRQGLRPPRNDRMGFTLIEVLVAVSALAIGTVAITRVYSASLNAMETAQYNIDAVSLLKAAMGQAEEKAIADGGTSEGSASGEFASIDGMKVDMGRSDSWQWSREIKASGLQVTVKKESAPDESSEDGASGDSASGSAAEDSTGDSATAAEEEYALNEVVITVVNPWLNPAKKLSLTTYMEAKSAE
ncbi:MAG: prepilin-type N-terminal cleavage/methylation domain-containing protein [Candidatus Omnitrophica bacterium]|nr:prepilin-type N-terminal cleavage/methylation domain-containing protein [Candidatus Omnitrophota bacterium]